MNDLFTFCDELGPSRIIHVHQPSVGLKGILVVDNVACGPSIGGLRMATDVSVEECFRLARAMTLKNAAAGLRHGGGKSVLVGDPAMPLEQKEVLIRTMAASLRTIDDYIFGPDMGTNETCMAWVHDEIGRSVGLPKAFGGIPLDELGATGWGVAHATEVAQSYCDLDLSGARVAIQGFGAVGMHSARFLADKGCVIVAASDSGGAIHDPNGLDVGALISLKKAGGKVTELPGCKVITPAALIGVPCDIWIPAARPDVINEGNAVQLKAKLVVQGANIPITPGAEQMLHERNILSIPDFIANAGGVICAAMEYAGASESVAFTTISEKISENTRAVLEHAKQEGLLPRVAAEGLAQQRLRQVMGWRRFNLFAGTPGAR